MITIRSLLDRIRWDPGYGLGEFAVGYYDRVAERVIVVPCAEVRPDPDNRFVMQVVDRGGEVHSIPLHRVRVVYRNGERIWARAQR
jgi:uncharacterized protein (UPF0248 family)